MEIPNKCNMCGNRLFGLLGAYIPDKCEWETELPHEIFFFCCKCQKIVGKSNNAIVEWFNEKP